MGRLIVFLIVLTGAAIAGLYFADVRFTISEDEAVQRELRSKATTEELNARVSDALVRGDVDDASMYAELATYMNRTLDPSVQAQLDEALSTGATVVRNTAGFVTGFVTGEGATTAQLAGAVTSDLTVVGDVRDIASEGPKMVAGQPYNEFLLGISVVGVAATAATIATGGGGIVAKTGVSIVKVAARAGTLTADFARTLTRLLRDSIDATQLTKVFKATKFGDAKATEDAMRLYGRGLVDAPIFPVLAKLGEIGGKAGPGETVRLLKYVRTADDVEDIAAMSTRLGKKTRGVIELTGKTSLRAFKTSLNILEFLIEKIWALGVWLIGLFGLGLARKVTRGLGGLRMREA